MAEDLLSLIVDDASVLECDFYTINFKKPFQYTSMLSKVGFRKARESRDRASERVG